MFARKVFQSVTHTRSRQVLKSGPRICKTHLAIRIAVCVNNTEAYAKRTCLSATRSRHGPGQRKLTVMMTAIRALTDQHAPALADGMKCEYTDGRIKG